LIATVGNGAIRFPHPHSLTDRLFVVLAWVVANAEGKGKSRSSAIPPSEPKTLAEDPGSAKDDNYKDNYKDND